MTILRERNISHQTIVTGLFFSLFISPSYALESNRTGDFLTEGISMSVGLEFDSGDYGTADTTDTWRIPFGVQYNKGQYFAGLNSSYISTKSTGNIILSNSTSHMKTITTTTSTSTTISKASGLGDLNLYAGYNFPAVNGGNRVYSVTARLKLATADENKGLGTGENDYAIEAGLLNKFQESSLLASVGYQINGDTTTVNYKDVVYANAGIIFPLQSGNQIGSSLNFSQSATPGLNNGLDLTGFMNIALPNKRSLYIYAMLGLSDGSPDYGFGANYRFGF